MNEDRAHRAVRARNAVAATVNFLAQEDPDTGLPRCVRALAVHRLDRSCCVSCGQAWPCRIAALAEVAAARVRKAAAERPEAAAASRRRRGPYRASPETGQGESGRRKGAA